MHELSLVHNILEAALEESRKANDRRIKRINATLREHGHPMDSDSLESLLETLARGTAAEGAEMKINVIHPTLRCKECGFSFAQGGTLICPQCRNGNLEDVDGEEIDFQYTFVE
ncbi:hydrogenase maturation nickel metallochaperone HypA [Chloroflexota bacterium]